ncbi:MAG: cell division protein SepF, partial [Solirubrobacterales bacterium]
MMAKVLNKMMGFLGLEDDFDDEVDETAVTNEYNEAEAPQLSNSKKKSNVVSIHTTISAKVKILKPTCFEEAADICDDVKNRK